MVPNPALLFRFIIKYVLCNKCKYPELNIAIDKKSIAGVCNSCGSTCKMDATHKAGKQLMKDIVAFYVANPSFVLKRGSNTDGEAAATGGAKKKKKKKA